MTAAIELIQVAEENGVVMWAENGRVEYMTPHPLSPEYTSFVKQNRESFVEVLEQRCIDLGRLWIEQHRDELTAAGFTEADLYNRHLPIGLLYSINWGHPQQSIVIQEGLITITYTNLAGRVITQTSRPESHIGTPIH